MKPHPTLSFIHKHESFITSVSLIVFAISSFVIAYMMPVFLSVTYYTNEFAFDTSLCGSLLNLYGWSLVANLAIVVGWFIADAVYFIKERRDTL